MLTERLELRPWTRDDLPRLRALTSDPLVVRYIGDGATWAEERLTAFVAKQRRQLRAHGFCLWAVVLREQDWVIGYGGAQPLAETGDVEIGWCLERAYWGRGLATELGSRTLEYLFHEVGLSRAVAITYPENSGSINVMRKLGMNYERSFEYRGIDVALYAIEKGAGNAG